MAQSIREYVLELYEEEMEYAEARKRGVELEPRFLIGFTPLHECCYKPSEISLRTATSLIEAGADVNAQTRYGLTPLHLSVFVYSREFVSLLISKGADPMIRDNDGNCPLYLAPTSLQVVMGEYGRRALREERSRLRSEQGGLQLCSLCSSDSRMRCSGCYLAWYCDRNCQTLDWKKHRKLCKATQAEYKTLYLGDFGVTGTCFITGKLFTRNLGDRPQKSHFVVKFIASHMNISGAPEGFSMAGYAQNKDKLLYSPVLTDREENYQVLAELREIIEREGVAKYKGYFYAKIGPNDDPSSGVIEIKINSKRILPPENW